MSSTVSTRSLRKLIKQVEADHFRTDQDSGANSLVMMVWNNVRIHAGLPRLTREDLPTWDPVKKAYLVKTKSN